MSDTEYTVIVDLGKLPRALPEVIFEPGCSECAELEVKLAAAEAREKALRTALRQLTDWGLSADDVVAVARDAIVDTGEGEGVSS